jgi:hypothetical protein
VKLYLLTSYALLMWCLISTSILVELRQYATSRKVAGSIPDDVIGFFKWPNPCSRTMALASTKPLTEMSIRKLPGGKGQPACKADNLTATCELFV